MGSDIFHILLIEDSEVDAMLMREVLERLSLPNEVTLCRDGAEAVEYLSDESNSLPQLTFLDINMPRMHGKEVLEFIKTNDRIKHIPVIMLSSSDVKKDVIDCYRLQANSYIKKPTSVAEYDYFLRVVDDFWLNYAQLPVSA